MTQSRFYTLNVEHLREVFGTVGVGPPLLAAPGLHLYTAVDQLSNANVKVSVCKPKQIGCLTINKKLFTCS